MKIEFTMLATRISIYNVNYWSELKGDAFLTKEHDTEHTVCCTVLFAIKYIEGNLGCWRELTLSCSK